MFIAFWGLSPRSLDVAGADARMRVNATLAFGIG